MTDLALYFLSVAAWAALTVAVLSIACLACVFLGSWLHDRAAARFDRDQQARVAAEYGSEPYSHAPHAPGDPTCGLCRAITARQVTVTELDWDAAFVDYFGENA